MIGGFACYRRGGDADFELIAFGFANRIALGTGRAKDVEHQHITVPLIKQIG